MTYDDLTRRCDEPFVFLVGRPDGFGVAAREDGADSFAKSGTKFEKPGELRLSESSFTRCLVSLVLVTSRTF
jgi:hypothetical protein